MISKSHLEHTFAHHAPSPEKLAKHENIRKGALAFAEIVVENTEMCPDQSAAVRKILDAMMTANHAIACDGK